MPRDPGASPWREQDLLRVLHMLEAAREAVAFASTRTRDSLRRGNVPTLGLVKELEIIGEAASKIDAVMLNAMPHIEWPRIIGMRNRLVHGYFDINLDIVWATPTDVLPPFIKELESFLKREAPTLLEQ